MKIKWKFVFRVFGWYLLFLIVATAFCDVFTVLVFEKLFLSIDVLFMSLGVTILSPLLFALMMYDMKGSELYHNLTS
jgi:hypothetical protein